MAKLGRKIYSHSTAATAKYSICAAGTPQKKRNCCRREIFSNFHSIVACLMRQDGCSNCILLQFCCFNFSIFPFSIFRSLFCMCVSTSHYNKAMLYFPSLPSVADLANKSFHRSSASRQEIPFRYILKEETNISGTLEKSKCTGWLKSFSS